MKKIDRAKRLSGFLTALVLTAGFFGFPTHSFAETTSSTESGIQNVQTGFNDVTRTNPYYVGIMYLQSIDLVQGYEDGTFLPNAAINKAEVNKLVISSLKVDLDTPFEPVFSDMTEDLWYAPYVMKAYSLGFVTGNSGQGTFTGGKQVNLSEFLKMLLAAHQIDVSAFEGKAVVPNIPADAWYANYLNYAVALGIVPTNADGTVDPGHELTRGEVANMMYLLDVILKGSDTQFLLSRAEAEMAQIEVYIAANQVALSKNASDLAVDFTQQALKNMPDSNVVLGAAKIARAYDWLVEAYILGIQGKNDEAAQKANDTIDKATEAWEANHDTQPIAAHIKDRAREILAQVGGVEQ